MREATENDLASSATVVRVRGSVIDVEFPAGMLLPPFFRQIWILEHPPENPRHRLVAAGQWRVVSYSNREDLTHLRFPPLGFLRQIRTAELLALIKLRAAELPARTPCPFESRQVAYA